MGVVGDAVVGAAVVGDAAQVTTGSTNVPVQRFSDSVISESPRHPSRPSYVGAGYFSQPVVQASHVPVVGILQHAIWQDMPV